MDRPDAPQTTVRFLAPSPRFADPSRVPLRLLGTILGGSFTSRLNQNLREKHGYTYGAGARFLPGPVLGTFSAGAEVTAKDTGPALKEFLKEFARLTTGDVTDAEVGKARGLVKNGAVGAFSGLSGIVGTATAYVEIGAPFETLGEDLAVMQTTTRRGPERGGEDGRAARPGGPRPRGRQGDDPSPAQGGGAPGADGGRQLGGENEREIEIS